VPQRTARRWLGVTAAAFGLAAVVLAALGAHAVPLSDASAASLWHTALEIHMFHAAALLAVAGLVMHGPVAGLARAGAVMALGTLLFSGSLYLRAAGIELLPGYFPPAGGLLLIASWLWLAIALARKWLP